MNYGQGRRPVGASTITQQVAKNILLGSNEVSLARKAREAILAIRLEETLSKERILELYLNEIYLGLQSYGVAAAAQAYFNKPLDELTLPEAAFLAALPKAPNNYNPFRFPDAAKARRDWVLDRMAEDHVDHRRAGRRGQGAADRAGAVPPAGDGGRRRLFRRGGPPAAGRAVRRRRRPRRAGWWCAPRSTRCCRRPPTSALRDGLMRYDRRRGGWRGPVTRLPAGAGAAHRLGERSSARWPAAARHAAGLAARRGAGDHRRRGEARRAGPAAAATPRVLPMLLADLGWARPVQRAGRRGGAAARRLARSGAAPDRRRGAGRATW